jgi:hypothetical protein
MPFPLPSLFSVFPPPDTRVDVPIDPKVAEDRLHAVRAQIKVLQLEEAALLKSLGWGKLMLVHGIPPEQAPSWGGLPMSPFSGKIATIKAIRELTHWGLKESKDFVESLPGVLDVSPEHPIVQDMIRHGAVFQYTGQTAPVGDQTAPDSQDAPSAS